MRQPLASASRRSRSAASRRAASASSAAAASASRAARTAAAAAVVSALGTGEPPAAAARSASAAKRACDRERGVNLLNRRHNHVLTSAHSRTSHAYKDPSARQPAPGHRPHRCGVELAASETKNPLIDVMRDVTNGKEKHVPHS
jgi:hypothetical protein